ncbi:MAG: DUF1540 domain-containing protein [Chitinispirillaceae bacterium]|jgi:hypothetical protein|nr:DUF1540 domain-containing protein [Chitinispirillaceae bacterium]
MERKVPEVSACEAIYCSYNREGQCHTPGINVGDSDPRCDTFFSTGEKGGFPDVQGLVGACRINHCRFNTGFECSASAIQVRMVSNRAMCGTFVNRP